MPRLRRARAGTQGNPSESDWQAETIEALDAFVSELPSDAPGTLTALYDELTALFLHAAITGIEEQRTERAPSEASTATPCASWPDFLGGMERRPMAWLDGDVASLPLLSRCGISSETVAGLQRSVRALARRAERGVDGPVRELGGLYELLLGFRLERLPRAARRLRRTRAWLAPAAVLEWPPATRGKRLEQLLALDKHREAALREPLARARTEAQAASALAPLFDARCEARAAGRYVLQPGNHRRSRGAHYTPWPLCVELVRRTLEPLTANLPEPRSRSLLELRICDPAMGAGAFLIASGEHLATLLAAARRREGSCASRDEASALAEARRDVTERSLFGVDKDPIAVCLARVVLSWFGGRSASGSPELRRNLRRGDALIGGAGRELAPHTLPEGVCAADVLDWRSAFPSVFEREEHGFDAVLGNPPWVAYVGRAAQPLPKPLAAYYAATNPAFRRYRTLHGLFVYRSATLLRNGGRLGLVLPTSVADLDGYAATRSAHDALCEVDAELIDFGDGAFEGVFQPSMALLSTRLARPGDPLCRSVWPLANPELSSIERELLERSRSLARFPPAQFGERGFQTTRDDQSYLVRQSDSSERYPLALREGADIGEFRALSPRLFADPKRLGARLRPPGDWQKVAVLIRQTARFPIAARADGVAFRNSILAGFESDDCPTALLLVWLNSSLVRWMHYSMHRDARQGMPQLKIGHLRALPAPPQTASAARAALVALGSELGARNHGVTERERARLDELVARTFGLTAAEQDVVEKWALAHPVPASRRGLTQRLSASTGGPSGALEVAAPG